MGYVKVRDGSSATAPLLGTYCSANHNDVATTGNSMFVEYYSYYRGDTYKATISSKTGTNLLFVGLVQGKCMKNVEYYYERMDSFKATVTSKKGTNLLVTTKYTAARK